MCSKEIPKFLLPMAFLISVRMVGFFGALRSHKINIFMTKESTSESNFINPLQSLTNHDWVPGCRVQGSSSLENLGHFPTPCPRFCLPNSQSYLLHIYLKLHLLEHKMIPK